MQRLNLPTYSFKIKSEGRNNYIFDRLRKKYVKLTPEEWVRQNFIMFLERERGYPVTRIATEKGMNLRSMEKRADILVYDSYANPLLLAECKAPDVTLNNEVFQQVSAYNLHFKVRYLALTNGMDNYCCRLDYNKGEITFLDDIPYYKEIDLLPD